MNIVPSSSILALTLNEQRSEQSDGTLSKHQLVQTSACTFQLSPTYQCLGWNAHQPQTFVKAFLSIPKTPQDSVSAEIAFTRHWIPTIVTMNFALQARTITFISYMF